MQADTNLKQQLHSPFPTQEIYLPGKNVLIKI